MQAIPCTTTCTRERWQASVPLVGRMISCEPLSGVLPHARAPRPPPTLQRVPASMHLPERWVDCRIYPSGHDLGSIKRPRGEPAEISSITAQLCSSLPERVRIFNNSPYLVVAEHLKPSPHGQCAFHGRGRDVACERHARLPISPCSRQSISINNAFLFVETGLDLARASAFATGCT